MRFFRHLLEDRTCGAVDSCFEENVRFTTITKSYEKTLWAVDDAVLGVVRLFDVFED